MPSMFLTNVDTSDKTLNADDSKSIEAINLLYLAYYNCGIENDCMGYLERAIKLMELATNMHSFLAKACNSAVSSSESISGNFIRHKAFAAKSVQLIQNSTRYAGNKNLLTDGIRGSNGYWDHAWQGYEGTDFEIIIDLHQAKQINSVTVGLLENPRDWIMLPVKIECSSSYDGFIFRIPVTTMVPENKNMKQTEIKDIKTELTTNSRYLRIKAFNMVVMPEWHPGKGGKPWIFVDEIMVD
jgi:hypothetical protein